MLNNIDILAAYSLRRRKYTYKSAFLCIDGANFMTRLDDDTAAARVLRLTKPAETKEIIQGAD